MRKYKFFIVQVIISLVVFIFSSLFHLEVIKADTFVFIISQLAAANLIASGIILLVRIIREKRSKDKNDK